MVITADVEKSDFVVLKWGLKYNIAHGKESQFFTLFDNH